MKLIKHAIECFFFSLLEHEGLLHLPYIIVQLNKWLVLRKYQKYREKIIFLKASWRCLEGVFARGLEDVFWRRIWKASSRCLQDVFIETNVWWEMLFFNRYLNLFHLSVAFHKENQSIDLPCISNDCFFINCNSGLKWVERALHQWNISPTLLVKD